LVLVHRPLQQVSKTSHRFPHPPQFSLSCRYERQVPLHGTWKALQGDCMAEPPALWMHWPMPQTSPSAQKAPHAPQLARSVQVLTRDPLQDSSREGVLLCGRELPASFASATSRLERVIGTAAAGEGVVLITAGTSMVAGSFPGGVMTPTGPVL
jgi:hypothetical protein